MQWIKTKKLQCHSMETMTAPVLRTATVATTPCKLSQIKLGCGALFVWVTPPSTMSQYEAMAASVLGTAARTTSPKILGIVCQIKWGLGALPKGVPPPFAIEALYWFWKTKKAQNLKLKSISTNNNFFNIFILIPSSSCTPRCTKGNPLTFIVLLTKTLYRKVLHYLRIASCLAWVYRALEISDRCRLLSSQPRVTVCCTGQ